VTVAHEKIPGPPGVTVIASPSRWFLTISFAGPTTTSNKKNKEPNPLSEDPSSSRSLLADRLFASSS
jgi:hypothetical protein